MNNLKKEKLEQNKIAKIIEIEAALVTGADQVIRNVLREVLKQYNVKL